MLRSRLLPFILALSFGSTSCLFQKSPTAPVICAAPAESPAKGSDGTALIASATRYQNSRMMRQSLAAYRPPCRRRSPLLQRRQNGFLRRVPGQRPASSGAPAPKCSRYRVWVRFSQPNNCGIITGQWMKSGPREESIGKCRRQESESGTNRNREPDSDLPKTSRAGARARSGDRSQPREACRSPRARPRQAPALMTVGSEGPQALEGRRSIPRRPNR